MSCPLLWEALSLNRNCRHWGPLGLPSYLGDCSPVVGEQCVESSQDTSSNSRRAGWLVLACVWEVGEVLAPPE